jgi:uncharacterized protein YodC (DUF2158 family)
MPVVLGLALGLTVLATPAAEAHLFHKMYEPPETQMTRDTRLLQLLLDDPDERFELARRVWEGAERVRLKPGGFRRWLVRPNEPGMVLATWFLGASYRDILAFLILFAILVFRPGGLMGARAT